MFNWIYEKRLNYPKNLFFNECPFQITLTNIWIFFLNSKIILLKDLHER